MIDTLILKKRTWNHMLMPYINYWPIVFYVVALITIYKFELLATAVIRIPSLRDKTEKKNKNRQKCLS